MGDLDQKAANIRVYPRYPRLKCLIRGSGPLKTQPEQTKVQKTLRTSTVSTIAPVNRLPSA